MDSNRANFSPSTKLVIAKKANYLCSFNSGNYRCLRLTSCSSTDLDDAKKKASPLLMGEACHIVAASKNGPRGSYPLSDAERASESNGIWLCQIHAAWIDKNNGNGYTVKELHEMRESHEKYVRSALEQGNCEYLISENGGLLTMINGFSYADEMYKQVVEIAYKDDELNLEQFTETVEEFRSEMAFWSKQPIGYRQLAGVVFQFGRLTSCYSVRQSVNISIDKLELLMKCGHELVGGFVDEVLCSQPVVGYVDSCNETDSVMGLKRLYLYGETLCYLKEIDDCFNFQGLFMYGEVRSRAEGEERGAQKE